LLHFGPDLAPAQELAVRTLEFDEERASAEIQLFDSHPPLWLLHETAVLCQAASEKSFASSAISNGSRMSHYCESGSSAEGKFFLVELREHDKEYVFIIFRQDRGDDDKKSELNLVTQLVQENGNVPESFHISKPPIHPSFLIEAIHQGKTVVIAGHSVGGVHASLLATKILREFKAHSQLNVNNLFCITFGAPVLNDENLAVNFSNYKNSFFHYVLENDIVAKSFYSQNEAMKHNHSSFPFGKVFIINRQESTKNVNVKLLHRNDMKEFYHTHNWKAVNGRELVVHHFMTQYYLQFMSTPLFAQFLLPSMVEIGSPSANAAASPKNPPAAGPTELVVQPRIRHCYLTGFELEIEGDHLSIVQELSINDHPIRFAVYSSNSIIARLERDEEETWFKSSNIVNITMSTIFSKGPNDFFHFDHLPMRILGNSKVDMFPNEMIASILPFTTLMLQDDSLKHSSNNYESVSDLLKDVDVELKKIESCIPAEFAFNMLTRDAQENNSVTSKENSNKHMKKFLKRLREVEIVDWSKLCSVYMLRVLKESIENLSEVLEEDKEVETVLKDAFSSHTLVNSWFDRLYVSTFDGFCESIYLANQAVSTRHFWDFVYKKSVKVGITFTMSGQKPFEYIPFNEPFRLKTAEGIVLIEKESSEATKDDAVIFINKYKLIIPGSDEIQTFHHIEVFKQPGTPETKLWISKITHLIGKIIIQCKSEIKKSNFNSILVQSFDDFVLSTWFTYAWFLQYERDWPTPERVNEINKILSEQIPLNKIESFNKMDFKSVHDEILKNIQSTYGFNIGLYFLKHPKRKVLVDLKLVREEMLSNHYAVSPPFFSGLAVDFDVRDPTNGFKTTPFFNFIPKAIRFSPETKWEEVLKNSIEVTDGLEFMLLMLDRYVLLTRQEVYQIKNTFQTRAKNTAIAAVQFLPATVMSGYEMMRYLGDRRVSRVVNVEQRFRRMYDKIVFSDQQVKSYRELLCNLVSLLSLEIDTEQSSIEMIEDVLYYSIPSAVGKYSLSELIVHCDEIFPEDIPVYQRWKELLNPRSKAVHLFIMKQIYHCHRLRMLRSKFITIGVNGQKNSGKSTLVQKVCGENYLPHIITGENPRESTIFPTGYHYP
jgi:hypothetical protein